MGIFLLGYAVYAAYCSKLPLPVQAGFCKSFVLLPISFLYICTLDNWSTQRIDAQHLFLALLCAEQAVLHIGDIFLHFPISLSPQLCVFPLLLYLGLSKVPVVHKSSRLVNHLKYKDMHSKYLATMLEMISALHIYAFSCSTTSSFISHWLEKTTIENIGMFIFRNFFSTFIWELFCQMGL